jgi:ABC-type protease/lipase transport system fused ATPase/permease subunit
MTETASWSWMTELEPSLLTIQSQVIAGELSMTGIMVNRILQPLVGECARHPRLRIRGSFRRVYRRLESARRKATSPRPEIL